MTRPLDQHGDLFQLKTTAIPSLKAGKYLLKSRSVETVQGVTGARFWIFDEEGTVLAEFAPSFACDCEYSLPTEYEMKDGTLFKYSGRSNDAWSEALCEWKAEVVCVAWKQLSPDDPVAKRILKK